VSDLARSIRLFSAFRREQTDPDFFYGLVARDTVDQLRPYVDLAGALVLDVGCGPGYFSDALRAAGGRVVCVDVDAGEMSARGGLPDAAVLGSALQLPMRTGSVDLCFSSNVLEHVPDPFAMADEMVRVTRPGGTVYLSFTNWLSPWGGHETSPWHYLGGHRAARRYQRRTGRPPKNRYDGRHLGRRRDPVGPPAAVFRSDGCAAALPPPVGPVRGAHSWRARVPDLEPGPRIA
jgi:SAM-dependent methyltransferase